MFLLKPMGCLQEVGGRGEADALQGETYPTRQEGVFGNARDFGAYCTPGGGKGSRYYITFVKSHGVAFGERAVAVAILVGELTIPKGFEGLGDCFEIVMHTIAPSCCSESRCCR